MARDEQPIPMRLVQQEAAPTIVITGQRQSVGPQQYELVPQVQIRAMPGGWTTAHTLLCQALGLVAAEMVKEVRPQQLVVMPPAGLVV